MSLILVIEDETDIADLIALHLQREGFTSLLAYDGISGLALAKSAAPALILLDLMLPGMDGVRVFKELRRERRTLHTPVIMLTARAQTEDRVAGLELGADDYITKPFSPKELLLRIKSVLKRSDASTQRETLSVGPFRFDAVALQCYSTNEPLDLTLTEYKLLQHLCEHADQPCDRNDLLRSVWGYSDAANSRTLDTHIKRLRVKLGPHAESLETARGTGYLLRTAVA
ncbi:MAG: response regulator transcription factor [Verrucomicrobia bacterium]|nr:MAG: response regulator transcription factor [Verrucomicrobiota bacterium]